MDALDGAPGVHSARFAVLDRSAGGPPASSASNTPDADNNAKLLRLLKDVPLEKRTARFRCVIALAGNQSAIRNPQFRNCLTMPAKAGFIFEPRGKNGFGYDPLFVPVGFEQTFAELGEDVKNQLSHRAKALAKLKDYFCNAK